MVARIPCGDGLCRRDLPDTCGAVELRPASPGGCVGVLASVDMAAGCGALAAAISVNLV